MDRVRSAKLGKYSGNLSALVNPMEQAWRHVDIKAPLLSDKE
jgi:hypothetical protein